MRDINRINNVCNELSHIWKQVPDWRLGQLLWNAFNINNKHDIFYMEDNELIEYIKNYINFIKQGINNMFQDESFVQYGWVCPRCGRINAPFMPCCPCGDVPNTVSSTQTYPQDDRVKTTTTTPDTCINTTTTAHNSPMKDTITLDTSKLSEEDKKNLETFISEWR